MGRRRRRSGRTSYSPNTNVLPRGLVEDRLREMFTYIDNAFRPALDMPPLPLAKPAVGRSTSGIRITTVPVQAPPKKDFRPTPFQGVTQKLRSQNVPHGETLVCVQRAQRKEVLHALKVSGKSGISGPRYNKVKSRIKC